jgi:hypothetical protein
VEEVGATSFWQNMAEEAGLPPPAVPSRQNRLLTLWANASLEVVPIFLGSAVMETERGYGGGSQRTVGQPSLDGPFHADKGDGIVW